MKTQISRWPNEEQRRYSGVYQQQGRMLTDADWNTLTESARITLERALSDVIGGGSPEIGGLVVEVAPGVWGLRWGRAYVDGIGAQVVPAPGALLVDPAGLAFEYDQQADLPAPRSALPVAAPFQFYLDVWARTVTALEDAELMDPGLHGADTTTRTQTMAQVKWADPGFDPEDPAQNPPIGTALVSATVRQGVVERDPCEPCADEIELQARVGNYVFRVEIHDVQYDAGRAVGVTLKWSSENAAEAARIGDEAPGFIGDNWLYEFHHGAAEQSATEKQLGYYAPAARAAWSPVRGQLAEGFPPAPPGGFSLVRRWDGYLQLQRGVDPAWTAVEVGGVVQGVDRGQRLSLTSSANAHGHLEIVGGTLVRIGLDSIDLEIELADAGVERALLAGDYWLASVRERVHVPGSQLLLAAPPVGIRHHYLCLASVAADGTITPLGKDNCRRHGFPRLTDVGADDVCYDNTACDMPGVRTVQDALDHLCQERDLAWHNQHLHGWGIVCGLILQCGPDTTPGPDGTPAARRQVRLTSGYALECSGEDVVLDADHTVDLIDVIASHDANTDADAETGAGAQARILNDGNGTACLVLGRDADGAPTVVVEPYRQQDNDVAALLDGTLLMDFFQDCVLGLVMALRSELSFLDPAQADDGTQLITENRRKLTAAINLGIQLINRQNGAYVFLSGPRADGQGADLADEHRTLADIYLSLRLLLQSKTFCAMFVDDVFPSYPFAADNLGMKTITGRGTHTRIKLHPNGTRLYTYGAPDNTIHVYDIPTCSMVEILPMPTAAGAEVTAIAFSPDGGLLYAAATVRGEDTIFGAARISATAHRWEDMVVLCDLTITEMFVSRFDAGLIYALGRGRGLFLLRPSTLTDNQTESSVEPAFAFNASGHLVVDEPDNRALARAFATGTSAAGEPSSYNQVAIMDLAAATPGGNQAPTATLNLLGVQGSPVLGEDGLALRPASNRGEGRLYVLTGVGSSEKQLQTYAGTGAASGFRLVNTLVVESSDIAIAYHAQRDQVLLAIADGYRLQAITADGGQTAVQRIPVQVNPLDLVVSPASGEVYALNFLFLTNTISVLPSDELDISAEFLNRLAEYRADMLRAFYALFGGLLQYLKDCFCDHLLVRCPECTGAERIYLGVAEIRNSQVYNICNFSKRKYVKSFPTVDYWLSLIPIAPLLSKLVEQLCCSVLPDFLSPFQDRVVVGQPSLQTNAGAGAAQFDTRNVLAASQSRTAVHAAQRIDVGRLVRGQIGGGQVVGKLLVDNASVQLGGQQPQAGVAKQALLNANVAQARSELELNRITVQTERYDPKVSGQYLEAYRGTPGRIPPGSTVTLYEQDGKVRFYALKATAAPDDAALGVRLAELEARKVALANDEGERARLAELEVRKQAVLTDVTAIEQQVQTLRATRLAEEERLAALVTQRETLANSVSALNDSLQTLAGRHDALRLEIARDRPVSEVAGVTPEMDNQLRTLGIRTVGELAAADVQMLRERNVVTRVADARAVIAAAQLRLR